MKELTELMVALTEYLRVHTSPTEGTHPVALAGMLAAAVSETAPKAPRKPRKKKEKPSATLPAATLPDTAAPLQVDPLAALSPAAPAVPIAAPPVAAPPAATPPPAANEMTEAQSKQEMENLALAFVARFKNSTPPGVEVIRALLANTYKTKRMGDLVHTQRLQFITIMKTKLEAPAV